MRRNVGVLHCIACVIASITACKTPQPRPPEPPDEEITAQADRLEWRGGGLDVATAVLHATLHNPTEDEATVIGAHLAITLGGKSVAAVDLPLLVTVAPAATVSLTLPANVSFGAAQAGEADTVLPAMATAAIKFDDDSVLEITTEGGLRTPKLPIVTMSHIEAYSSDKGVALTFYLEIKNPNGFDLRTKGLHFKADVDFRTVAEGDSAVNDRLKAGTRSVYEISAPLTADTYGKDLPAGVRLGMKYKITGTLDMGVVAIPVVLEGDVPLRK